MFAALSTSSTFLPKILTDIPVLKHTCSRSKIKVNVESCSRVKALKYDIPVDKSLIFNQDFTIRSYEIGADGTASIVTMMNLLQEIALNHAKSVEVLGDGFATLEMCKMGLVWVVAQIEVIVDRYPIWRDTIDIDTWVGALGKNGMRREWLVRDSVTGDIIARASSVCVAMNKKTRKLARLPAAVHEEIDWVFAKYSTPLVEMETRKLPKLDDKTAHSVCSGLTPKWNELDVNQHVNHVKYCDWILESVPLEILKTHKLVGMSMKYRRESTSDSVLQSLTSIVGNDADLVECQHLLCLEGGGGEIVKGMTKWKCP